MNYKIIHDAIIENAKIRIYNSSLYQNHHIVPICEDNTSTKIVPLTIKEHRIIHFLRYKMGFHLGNYKAYLLMKGFSTIESHLIIASNAGKLGGRTTRDNKSGIFSDNWDRSAQSKLNHINGIIDYYITSEIGKKFGIDNVKNKIGIHNPEYIDQRTEWAKIGAEALELSGNRNGICSEHWRNDNKILALEIQSRGGKIGGKVVGSMPWWTNGIQNKRSYHCPDGWRSGMTKRKNKTLCEDLK